MTTLELTQVTIELSLAFAFVIAAILLLLNPIRKSGMKQFIAMFFTMAVILTSESLAYVCRGDIDTVSIVINRISNFLVFFCNFFIMEIFIRYIYSVFNDDNIKLSKIYLRFVDGVFIIAILILIINLFTGWMYSFDDMNYYKRNYMWYVFTSFSIVVPIVLTLICIKNRNRISKLVFWSILLYVWFPVIFMVIQAFIYGYSILTIGMAVDLLIMFAFYLIELRKTKMDDEETEKRRVKKAQSILLFSFLSIFISASIISCILSINKVAKDNTRSNSMVIASMIEDRISNEFYKPITVVETMSQDYIMKKSLTNSGVSGASSVADDMSKYLTSIKDGFGYQMVYAVADNSKAYYNSSGISRIIDENNYGEDVWYKEFYDNSKILELKVDTDKDSDYILSVFVNAKVFDDDGNLIGICGVGIEMQEIQTLIEEYEGKYNTSITLVDSNGLIQMARDTSKIEKEYVDIAYFEKIEGNSFYLIEQKNTYKLTKYINGLDLYIVIDFYDVNSGEVFEIITPSVIIFTIGIIMLIIYFVVNYIDDKRAYEIIKEKRLAAITDEMTGLYNRSAYEKDILRISNEDLSQYIIVQFDLDYLKTVNDSKGHVAGDELIVGIAHCILNVFRDFGSCYRIGGDEFLVLAKCKKDELEESIATFNHLALCFNGKYTKGISVSKGIVYCSEHPEMSLNDMIDLSDKLMYEDKFKERNNKEN